MRPCLAGHGPWNTVERPLARPASVALGRAAAGGVSLLVAIALAVNLTCRAAGPMLGSIGDGSHERQTLRHLTLAIHRAVRRLMIGERSRRKTEVSIRTRAGVDRPPARNILRGRRRP
ncbi:MAG TPA: hypothetical protein PKU91_09405, partial [Phycisphaerales bacterium]|nr:hypothetical protein [Phycisphaerales bacterium]